MSALVLRISHNGKLRRIAVPPEAPSTMHGQQDQGLAARFRRLLALTFGINPEADICLVCAPSHKLAQGECEVIIPVELNMLHQLSMYNSKDTLFTLLVYDGQTTSGTAQGLAPSQHSQHSQSLQPSQLSQLQSSQLQPSQPFQSQPSQSQPSQSQPSQPSQPSKAHQLVSSQPQSQSQAQESKEELRPNTVIALYDYERRGGTELSFAKGDRIRVESRYDDNWCKGSVGDEVGYFPTNHVWGMDRVSLPAAAKPHDSDYQDAAYFDSYATLSIHHTMLSDSSRTETYKQAVIALRDRIQDKIVLDVGCGSGVLSLFCAKFGGARHVYAVDASDIIRTVAKKVVNENGFNDKITLIQGKIEEINLPVAQVDVIISEWMGIFLLCESMIFSALFARNKYLAPGGVMMPSLAQLLLCPVYVPEYYDNRVEFWKDVHGVEMSSLVPVAKSTFFDRPIYTYVVKPEDLISDPVVVVDLNMLVAEESGFEVCTQEFCFVIKRPTFDGKNKATTEENHGKDKKEKRAIGVDETFPLHGFATWFDTYFNATEPCTTKGIVLSTSPHDIPTHWVQVMFVFPEPFAVKEGNKVVGKITISRHPKWRRHFDAEIELSVDNRSSSTSSASPSSSSEQQHHQQEKHVFKYNMWSVK